MIDFALTLAVHTFAAVGMLFIALTIIGMLIAGIALVNDAIKWLRFLFDKQSQ